MHDGWFQAGGLGSVSRWMEMKMRDSSLIEMDAVRLHTICAWVTRRECWRMRRTQCCDR